MAAQSGKDMLLKLDQTGSGSFLTVAGLRTRALAFNAAAIDVTDAESAGRWRELLTGGGIKRASVSGSGIFKDQTSDAKVRELFFGGTIRHWQLLLPDFGGAGTGLQRQLELTPDGSALLYVGLVEATTRTKLVGLDGTDPRILEGVEPNLADYSTSTSCTQ